MPFTSTNRVAVSPAVISTIGTRLVRACLPNEGNLRRRRRGTVRIRNPDYEPRPRQGNVMEPKFHSPSVSAANATRDQAGFRPESNSPAWACTREAAQARARMIARLDGRAPDEVSQYDYEQAKREITGKNSMVQQDALFDQFDGGTQRGGPRVNPRAPRP